MANTLKEISEALNISTSKASRIKRIIEETEYSGVPECMVWGTGTKRRYNINKFREYLINH